jgi:anti-anti-sigma factor
MLVFRIKGAHRLDLANAGILEKKVYKESTGSGTSVIIDLGGIRFVDTTGFSVLLRIQGRILDREMGFQVINISDEVMELIRLLKLDRVLDFTQGNPLMDVLSNP